MNEQNEIVLYQPNELTKLEVRVVNETVWLSQQQMAILFGVKENNITYHIKEIYKSNELPIEATAQKIRVVRLEGNRQVERSIDFYNLDMIISVGYRVNSLNATMFRRWATSVLKDYMLRGYAINQRLMAMEERIDHRLTQHEHILAEHQDKIDFFVRTSLPPIEGVFYNGQIFEAYAFVADFIKGAKKSIVLIDNYVDESVLTLLDKRSKDVTATIYTQKIDKQLRLDIDKHNAQYRPIDVQVCKTVHDRFLIIDETVYHIGASIKDLGKKLFAFSKMEMPAKEILKQIK
ncbi:MAG: virulence RhuM family protein [Paludibacteraceae bacterium]|nr:virulence RhuM family protein [Paludibacteraceae bacterium]